MTIGQIVNPFTVIVSFALFLLVLAIFKPQAGRIIFGVFFLLMAWGVNLPMMLYDPSLYPAAGAHAFIPLYRWFFTQVLALYPVPFILLLIAFETAIGLLTLSKGRWVKLGLGLGMLFCLGIAWIGFEGVWVPAVAVAPLVMLRKDFPVSVFSLGRSLFRTGFRSITGHEREL
jgi:hypothetical protein